MHEHEHQHDDDDDDNEDNGDDDDDDDGQMLEHIPPVLNIFYHHFRQIQRVVWANTIVDWDK